MADLFFSQDAKNLLYRKKVYLLGDSNIRALYKDIICLLQYNRILTNKELHGKAERSVLGDQLLRGSPLTKGREYREDRRYKDNNHHIEFHFITKCFNEDIDNMMEHIRRGKIKAPDIIIMNSTLWDVNRWGFNGPELFKENMQRLMQTFQSSLPASTLVIWVTAPPISVDIRGGFMIKQIEYAKFTMRFHVMEANMFARNICTEYGYNVLDFHFHLRWLVHWRSHDGLHWHNKAVRHLSNLVLTHISLALCVPLPGNHQGLLLERHKAIAAIDETARAASASASASAPGAGHGGPAPQQAQARGGSGSGAPRRMMKATRPSSRLGPQPAGHGSIFGGPRDPGPGGPGHQSRLQWPASAAMGPTVPMGPMGHRGPRPPLLDFPRRANPPPPCIDFMDGIDHNVDFTEDYAQDGPFFGGDDAGDAQPQQIQSLWGSGERGGHGGRGYAAPPRRGSARPQAARRQRPY